MKSFFLFLFVLFFCFAKSQSLDAVRVNRIKSATVRILIDSSSSAGTGFFVGNDGTVATCWHVVTPALRFDTAAKQVRVRRIFAQLNTGEKIELGIINQFLYKGYENALAYDYCLLIPLVKTKRQFPFLKMGDYGNVSEGDEIYTCGYPLGIPQQFISKGMVSTKYVDSSIYLLTPSDTLYKPRMQCLLDLTLNSGNSGGAIVKVGLTPDADEVIGIADFVINLTGEKAGGLVREWGKSAGAGPDERDINRTNAYFREMLSNTSVGISGCVSIQHLLEGYRDVIKPKG